MIGLKNANTSGSFKADSDVTVTFKAYTELL